MRGFLHRFLCGLMWGHRYERYGDVADMCRDCSRVKYL